MSALRVFNRLINSKKSHFKIELTLSVCRFSRFFPVSLTWIWFDCGPNPPRNRSPPPPNDVRPIFLTIGHWPELKPPRYTQCTSDGEGHPNGSNGCPSEGFYSGLARSPMCELGFQSASCTQRLALHVFHADGRPYFVDHNTMTTTWNDPRLNPQLRKRKSYYRTEVCRRSYFRLHPPFTPTFLCKWRSQPINDDPLLHLRMTTLCQRKNIISKRWGRPPRFFTNFPA